jgi:hypothetical protein
MDGFKAFKYYTSIKLHFSDPKFNVFLNRGNLRGSYESFLLRRDYQLFERMAREFKDDRQFILFLASNCMYGNPDSVYNMDKARDNYKEYMRRRQSITYIFQCDIQTIIDNGCGRENGFDIFMLYIANKITLETLVILNEGDMFVQKLKDTATEAKIFYHDLLVIEKSTGFVKYDKAKISKISVQYLEELEASYG